MDPKLPPASPESDVRSRRPRPRHIWTFERLEDRTLLATGPVVATPAQLAGAQPITSSANGFIAPGESDFFRVDATIDELLISQAHADGAQTRLSLLDSQGHLLAQSDGLSPSDPGDLIAQHIVQGTVYLEVTGTGGIGSYSLTTQEPASSEPGATITLSNSRIGIGYPFNVDQLTTAVVTGDFSGNRRDDIAASYQNFDPSTGSVTNGVAVLLANGDGTFKAPVDYPFVEEVPPQFVTSLVVGDFRGDGRLDIAEGYGSIDETGASVGGVSVLLGNGDGTFQSPVDYAAGGPVTSLAVGDFRGGGRLDIAEGYEIIDETGASVGGVSVLLGNGDGTFQSPVDYTAAGAVTSLAVGDFRGDGRLDIAAGTNGGGVLVLLANGDGTFEAPVDYTAGDVVTSLAVGDFRGDGRLDIAAGMYGSGDGVSVLLGNGNGTFQAPVDYAVGEVASLAVGDFAGDSRLDIAAGTTGGYVSVLLGNGDGTFQSPVDYSAEGAVTSLAVGDFRGDGRLDIAEGYGGFGGAGGLIGGVSVLFGSGNGVFQAPSLYAEGDSFTSLAVGDFNGDSRLDIAEGYQIFDSTTDQYVSGGVSVLLGNGDGTFQSPFDYAISGGVTSLAVGDFNGDGRLDIAAGTTGGYVSVLLGNGDGTFQSPVDYAAGGPVTSLAVGDFRGDGRLDIAEGYEIIDPSTNLPTGGGVSLHLSDGDGTFQKPVNYAAAGAVTSLAVGDFRGDGRLDIAAGYENINDTPVFDSGGVSVLLGDGDGTFQNPVNYAAGGKFLSLAAGGAVISLEVGDFTGNGRIDIAAGYEQDYNMYEGGASVLLGNGDGTFQSPVEYTEYTNSFGSPAYFLAVGDFTGDGRLDIADGVNGGGVSLLLGNGDGTFQSPVDSAAAGIVYALAVGDFTGDGRDDLAYIDGLTGLPSVLLNTNSETLSSATDTATPIFNNPLLADLTGDGTNDLTVIDQSGDILWRRGIPGQPGSYEPPIVVNPGIPSRDIAIVANGGRNLVASVDAKDNFVTLYAFENGGFVVVSRLPTGPLPAQIITANLTGDGIEDLVVRNAGDGSASIYLGNANGGFTPIPALPIGLGASDVAAADLANSGRDDLVVTNQATGDVHVFPNILPATYGPPAPYHYFGNANFGTPSFYQAGNGPYSLTTNADESDSLTSQESTAGLAVGTFAPGSTAGLAVINPGTNTLAILNGLGGGNLANARVLPTIAPGSIVRADDLRSDGITDLVVLTSKGLDVYLGDGRGGFSAKPEYSEVGPDPTGLTAADVNRDGTLDLLIGNQYGDVLELLGNGNGTFRPFQSADRGIALAVADLDGTGQRDFIYANQGLDRVSIQYGNAGPTVLAGPQQGLLAPGAVTVANFTIGGVTSPYLIVANSGSNDVLVYPGLGNGKFGPALNGGNGFFTGTNPVSVTVAYLDSNGLPDRNGLPDLVVADKGSNDVSILLGQMQNGSLTFVPGPRLKAGLGPVSTVVTTLPGNPYPDLLVTDSQSNQVLMLKGLGQGFFDDQSPTIIPVGVDPGPLFVGDFTGRAGEFDLVTVNPGSDSLSFVANFLDGGVALEIPSGGSDPIAAVAFSDGGAEGLLVANEGDGVLALFLSGLDGLDSPLTMEDPNVPNPTALALDTLTGDVLQFYAGTAGVEAATLLQFNLGDQGIAAGGGISFAGGGVGGGISSPLSAPEAVLQVARLQPLGDSSLAIVATLLTVTTESNSIDSHGEGEVEATVAIAQGAAGAQPNQPDSRDHDGTSLEEVASTEDQGDETTPALPAQGPLSPLNRFLYRLDDAVEKARQDARESTFEPTSPLGGTERSVRALDAVLAGWSVQVGVIAARAIDAAVQAIPNRPIGPAQNRPMSPVSLTTADPDDPDPTPSIAAAAAFSLALMVRTLGDDAQRRLHRPLSTR